MLVGVHCNECRGMRADEDVESRGELEGAQGVRREDEGRWGGGGATLVAGQAGRVVAELSSGWRGGRAAT